MNKKIGFIFLVLLCSLNVGMFSRNADACYNFSIGNGLSIKAVKIRSSDEDYDYVYRVTLVSTLSDSTVIINSVKSTEDRYRFLNKPVNKRLAPGETITFTYKSDCEYVARSPEIYINITAQLCEY